MTRIRASVSAIKRFESCAADFQRTASDASSTVFELYAQLINYTFDLLKSAEECIFRADKIISSGEAKRERLEQELKRLEAELAKTPPTVTESYSDGEGNTYFREVANPAYHALQRAISQVQDRISKVRSVLNRTNVLKNRIESEKMTLNACLGDFDGQKKSAFTAFKNIDEKTSLAVKKLKSLTDIVSGYNGVKIGGGLL